MGKTNPLILRNNKRVLGPTPSTMAIKNAGGAAKLPAGTAVEVYSGGAWVAATVISGSRITSTECKVLLDASRPGEDRCRLVPRHQVRRPLRTLRLQSKPSSTAPAKGQPFFGNLKTTEKAGFASSCPPLIKKKTITHPCITNCPSSKPNRGDQRIKKANEFLSFAGEPRMTAASKGDQWMTACPKSISSCPLPES